MQNESEKLLKIRRIAIENVENIRNWVRDFPLWLCRGVESNFWQLVLVYGKSMHQLRLCRVIAIKIESN